MRRRVTGTCSTEARERCSRGGAVEQVLDGLRRRHQWAQAADGRCAGVERRPSSAAAAGSDRTAANASVPRRRPGADGASPRSHRPPRQRRCHGPHGRRVGRLTRPRRRPRLHSSTPRARCHLHERSSHRRGLRSDRQPTHGVLGRRALPRRRVADACRPAAAKVRDAGITVRQEVAVSMRPVAGAHVVTTPSGQLHADASVLAIGSAGELCRRARLHARSVGVLGPAAEVACLELGLRRPPTRRFALGIDEPLYFSTHCPPARLAPDGAAVVHLMAYLPGRRRHRLARSQDTTAIARPPHGGDGRGHRHRAVPRQDGRPDRRPDRSSRRTRWTARHRRAGSATGCTSPATGSVPRACSATLSQPVRWLPVGPSRRTCLRCWRCHDDDPRRSRRGGLLRPTRSVGRRRLPDHRLAERRRGCSRRKRGSDGPAQRPVSIDNPPGWLTTVTSESPSTTSGRHSDGVSSTSAHGSRDVAGFEPAPDEQAEMAESLTMGFLAVLEHLKPIERAVFVLVRRVRRAVRRNRYSRRSSHRRLPADRPSRPAEGASGTPPIRARRIPSPGSWRESSSPPLPPATPTRCWRCSPPTSSTSATAGRTITPHDGRSSAPTRSPGSSSTSPRTRQGPRSSRAW